MNFFTNFLFLRELSTAWLDVAVSLMADSLVIQSPNGLQDRLKKASILILRAEKKSDPGCSPTELSPAKILLANDLCYLVCVWHWVQNDFAGAYRKTFEWENVTKNLEDTAFGHVGLKSPRRDAGHSPYSLIARTRAMALLTDLEYGHDFSDQERPVAWERVGQALFDATSWLQNSKLFMEGSADLQMAEIQALRARFCFLQGNIAEAKQWLDRMVRHGTEEQRKQEYHQLLALNQRTGKNSGFAEFFRAHLAPVHDVSVDLPRGLLVGRGL